MSWGDHWTPPTGPPVVEGGPEDAWQDRPYPQLLRGAAHRWWRPLVATAAVLGGLTALAVLLAVVGHLAGPEDTTDEAFAAWTATPVGLLANNLLLAALIPLAAVAVALGHGTRPGLLSSVQGRLRWGWLARCLLVTVPLVVAASAVGYVLDPPDRWSPEPQAVALLGVVLLTTPLQAAGEEYAFRGWLTQAVGSWFRAAALGGVVAAVLSGVLFALVHGNQSAWLFADRLAFGLAASWLAWRTGGLEAPVALHAVNNVVVLVLVILGGGLADTLLATEADPRYVLVDLALLLGLVVAITLLARRGRVRTSGGAATRPTAPSTAVP